MISEPFQSESQLFKHWWRATFLGWLLGLVLLVVLILLWSPFGDEAQFLVGVGMGCGVGYVQGRVLRKRMVSSWRWCVASTIGMGTLYVLFDLSRLVGVRFPFSPLFYDIVGGCLVGLLQWPLLRPLSHRAGWWVPACVVGWGLPAGAIALGDTGMLGPWGSNLSPAGMLCGGVMHGAVSGKAIVWILRETPVSDRYGGSFRPIKSNAYETQNNHL